MIGWTSTNKTLCCLLVLLCFLSCTREYVGRPCKIPGERQPKEVNDPDSNTVEIYEQIYQGANVDETCESMICIATAGSPGYCSKKCRDVSDCPIGFICRVIYPFNPNDLNADSEQGYCAWKPCQTRADCGSPEQFECVAEPNSYPGDNEEKESYCRYPEK